MNRPNPYFRKSRLICRYLQAAVVFIIPFLAAAQVPENLRFEIFTSKNGLPNNAVHAITQDTYGYLWVGTNNGVSRFDGRKFVNFSVTGDSGSLRNNVVSTLQADSSGRVWIGSYGGLCYYNYAGNNFVYPKVNGREIRWINTIVMDRKNCLWFCCNLGLCRINTRTMEAEVITGRLNNREFTSIYADKFGRVWIGACPNEHFVYNASTDRMDTLGDYSLKKLGCLNISYAGRPDEAWIINTNDPDGGLFRWNKKAGQVSRYVPKNLGKDYFLGIWEYPYLTSDSIVWCARENEILLFNTRSERFVASFRNQNGEETNFPPELLGCHYIDKNNDLWIGSKNGLARLSSGRQQIYSFRIPGLKPGDLSAPIRKVVACKNRPGVYWVISFGAGVLLYDFRAKKILRRYLERQAGLNRNPAVNYDGIYDDAGQLWIASDAGLMRYDEQGDRFVQTWFSGKAADSGTVILKMEKGGHHELWLATTDGLWVYYPGTKKAVRINGLNSRVISAYPEDNAAVYYLKFARDGKLLTGTRRGLNILDTLTGRFTYVGRPDEDREIIENKNYIWGIDTDSENNVWVASNGGYIWKYNLHDGQITDYGPANGLTNPSCRDIFVDSLDAVWVSCRDGVFKRAARDSHFVHYTTEDGLYTADQGQGRWSIVDGKIFAGYDAALSIIDVYNRRPGNSSMPVWITGMKIFDRPLNFSPDSTSAREIRLHYTDNFITFEFTAVDFAEPDRTNFYFMLEGFDNNWINAGNRRFATYTNLEGGDYVFRVKAMNGDGSWSRRTASLKFHVSPAFWRTWWFRLFGIGLVGLAGIVVIRQRIRNIRKAAAFKQKISETEIMALQAQMNPHFIFNSLNSIENYMMRNEKLMASNYLNKFARLIRIILESTRKQLTSFMKDIEAIGLYVEMEQLRFNNRFCYKVEICTELQNGDYLVPPLLIQPFIENAIIHGLAPSEKNLLALTVTARIDGESIHYQIRDNGIGREQSRLYNSQNKPNHKSMGMEITNERLAIFNQQHHADGRVIVTDLFDENQQPAGTRVDLYIKAL